jgi:hypothetical protein
MRRVSASFVCPVTNNNHLVTEPRLYAAGLFSKLHWQNSVGNGSTGRSKNRLVVIANIFNTAQTIIVMLQTALWINFINRISFRKNRRRLTFRPLALLTVDNAWD